MAKKYKVTKAFTHDGKRYYIHADTEKEAIMKMANKLRDLEEGKVTINSSMTVKDWTNTCIESYKTNLKPISLTNYKSKAKKWLIDEIGTLKIRDVKPLHCQAILNKMDGMATDTIRKVSQIMNFVFSKAVQNKLILENPAEHLTLPIGTKSTRRAITLKERTHIMKVAEKEPRYAYFLTMLFCGCRPSEAAELQGMDVQAIDGKNILHIRGTKTQNADRYVPIPDELMRYLPKKEPFERLFVSWEGKPLTVQNRNHLWNHFWRDLNISMGCKVYRNQIMEPYPVADDLVPYCLRHTYCTDLQKKGIDIRTAQYLMGHADIKMTANIYTHTDTETVLEVADVLNGVAPTVAPADESIEK